MSDVAKQFKLGHLKLDLRILHRKKNFEHEVSGFINTKQFWLRCGISINNRIIDFGMVPYGLQWTYGSNRATVGLKVTTAQKISQKSK